MDGVYGVLPLYCKLVTYGGWRNIASRAECNWCGFNRDNFEQLTFAISWRCLHYFSVFESDGEGVDTEPSCPCEPSSPGAESDIVSKHHLTSSSKYSSDWSHFPQATALQEPFLRPRKHQCLGREFFPPHTIHKHCPPHLPGIVIRPRCCTRLTTPKRIKRRPLE